MNSTTNRLVERSSHAGRAFAASILACSLLTGGCAGGPYDDGPDDSHIASSSAAVTSDNGLIVNGLSTNGIGSNGLSTNGLSTNGLSTNGLSTNGLSTNGFKTWFGSNLSIYSNMVMSYVVRCAVPSGQSRTATINGVTYTWAGSLGLAPVWASGGTIPVAEQQIMTACLAAHANKFGLHISVSIRGAQTNGQAIPFTASEDSTYDEEEGCFFGNLFSGAGIFVAYSTGSFKPTWSSPRACAIESGLPGVCPPMVHVGVCQSYCTQFSKSSNGIVWGNCTYQGTSYKSLSTRLRIEDIAICGDGVCKFPEFPYSTSAKIGCKDCGTIP